MNPLQRCAKPRIAGLSHFWVVLLVVVACPAAAGDACVKPELIRIHDGDTVSLRCPGRVMKLRLAGIDAPEVAQPHGSGARAALAELVSGQQLSVRTRATDRYGRSIGDLIVNEASLAVQMVEQGWAWCSQRAGAACREREQTARSARRGLWQDDDPMPPWQWRKLHPRKP